MAIARSEAAFIGTNEGAGAAVAAGAVEAGSQVDVLGDNTSTGEATVFLVFTTPAAAITRGHITVVLYDIKANAGYSYQMDVKVFNLVGAAGATTYKIRLGRYPVNRYARADVKNQTDVALANVAVLYALEKFS